MPPKRIDLTDKVFGRLKVLRFSHKKGNKNYWVCQCSCGSEKGKEKIVRGDSLTSGNTESCGCISREMRMKDLHNMEFGRLKVIELSHSEKGRLYWLCECECGEKVTVMGGYLLLGDTKSCGCLKKEQDEINLREKYEEKRVNNVATHLLKSKLRVDNQSGVKGVYFDKTNKKYRAYIAVNGAKVEFSPTPNKEEAIRHRQEAEEKYHKPYIDKLEKKSEK